MNPTATTFTFAFERTEKKYLLSDHQYNALYSILQQHTKPDQYGETTIYNIYYDTPDFLLIRRSLEKPIFKEKIRLRTYSVPTDDTTAFVEIKRKYNGTVYKRRFTLPYCAAISYFEKKGNSSPQFDQIAKEIAYTLEFYQNLHSAMSIIYDRTALVGIEDPGLRITFDTNIRWQANPIALTEQIGGAQLLKENQRLMELKFIGAIPLWLSQALCQIGCFPTSFSKYGRAFQAMLATGEFSFTAPSTIESKYLLDLQPERI